MAKVCAIFLMAGASLLMGCSSNQLELPTCEIPEAPTEAQHPLSLPEMPQETSSTELSATFDLDGMLQFERFRQAALTNTEVAELNAQALEARNESINALIECSRYQKIWMEVREDMLEQERADHMMDNIWHRAVIVVGVGAALL